MRLLLPFCAALLLCACGATPKSDDYAKYKSSKSADTFTGQSVAISLERAAPVDFRAIYEVPGGQVGAVTYNGAAGAGGVLAQVIAHAAISASAQDAQLSAAQTAANKVLEPLRPSLQGFDQQALIPAGSTYPFVGDGTSAEEWVMDSRPIFYVSQDLKFVTLKHVVSIRRKNSKNAAYENLVEVVSADIAGDKPLTKLQANNAALLREIAKDLYGYSLSLVMADISGTRTDASTQQRSVSFQQGGKARVERGNDVAQDCNTAVMRNLRGWLIAYPVGEQSQMARGCKAGMLETASQN